MVGLLNAVPGTRLFKRLKSEKRILSDFEGNNMDGALNFIPKMNHQSLMNGYKSILKTIYSHKEYYRRIKTFLKEYKPRGEIASRLQFYHIRAFVKSIWFLGIREKGRKYYWKLFLSTLLKQPRNFPLSISLSVYGYHFRKVVEKYISLPIEDAGSSVN